MTSASRHRLPLLLPVLAALFFLSGASALIYQVLWLRLLGLVFGVTVYAASTVWAVFMAGLAIGTLAGGRLADRVRRPLVWFGLAEGAIALTALATPATLDAVLRLYASVHPTSDGSLATLTAVRVAMAFAVLVVPSTLMGATLPLVVRSSLLREGGLGGRVGVLYATNTAGAIAGTLAAGLVLVPRLGIAGAFLVAAAINAVVAVAGVIGGWRLPVGTGDGSTAAAPGGDAGAGQPTPAGTAGTTRLVLAVFALSGFVSLAVEVIWFRVLTLFLRPTVYGYAMMLAAVLAGIAAGSYLAAPFLRRRPHADWLLILGVLEGGIAIAMLASFLALPEIPALMAAIGPAVARVTGDYLAYQAIVSWATVLPAMVLFGAAFPIGLHVCLSDGTGTGATVARRVGLFYALNVTGAILGSLAAGFVLLPRLGSRASLLALAAASLAAGCALLAWSRSPGIARVAAAVALCVAGAGLARVTPDPFDAFLAQRYPGQAIVWQREAVQATVSVHQEADGHRSLNVSGNHQASTHAGMAGTHHRIGNLPMAVHPEARQALVIGLGGGATAGAVSRHSGVEVDVVELSPEVAEAAGRYFEAINFGVLRQPNVRLHVDDGRNYLLLNRKQYDVITADVILPIHAGAGNLYSVEYFTLARRALKPGGLMLQWVAGTEAEYQLIMRTFLTVFPETTLWGDGSLMLGSVEPLRLRKSDVTWKFDVPQRREMLASIGVRSFDDLLAQYVAGPQELRRYVGDGPVLTDDRPMVEYFLSLPRDRRVSLAGVAGDVRRHVVDP